MTGETPVMHTAHAVRSQVRNKGENIMTKTYTINDTTYTIRDCTAVAVSIGETERTAALYVDYYA